MIASKPCTSSFCLERRKLRKITVKCGARREWRFAILLTLTRTRQQDKSAQCQKTDEQFCGKKQESCDDTRNKVKVRSCVVLVFAWVFVPRRGKPTSSDAPSSCSWCHSFETTSTFFFIHSICPHVSEIPCSSVSFEALPQTSQLQLSRLHDDLPPSPLIASHYFKTFFQFDPGLRSFANVGSLVSSCATSSVLHWSMLRLHVGSAFCSTHSFLFWAA